MIEEAFGHRISQETLKEVLPDYQSLNQQLLNFGGTNIRNANFILNRILNDQETRILNFVEKKSRDDQLLMIRC